MTMTARKWGTSHDSGCITRCNYQQLDSWLDITLSGTPHLMWRVQTGTLPIKEINRGQKSPLKQWNYIVQTSILTLLRHIPNAVWPSEGLFANIDVHISYCKLQIVFPANHCWTREQLHLVNLSARVTLNSSIRYVSLSLNCTVPSRANLVTKFLWLNLSKMDPIQVPTAGGTRMSSQ